MRKYVDPNHQGRALSVAVVAMVLLVMLVISQIGHPEFRILAVPGPALVGFAVLAWRNARVSVVLGAEVVVVRNVARDFVFVWGEVLAVEDRGRAGFRNGGLHLVLSWGVVECNAFPSRPFSGRASASALAEVLVDAQEMLDAWRARSVTIS